MIDLFSILNLEMIRIIFVLCILAVNAFTDLKERVYFGRDRYYLIFGVIGFSLFLLDSVDSLSFSLFMLVIHVTLVLIMWRIKLAASGDIVVCLVFAVTVPIVSGWILLPLFAIIGGAFAVLIFGLLYNFSLNMLTLCHKESLYSKYNVSIFKKIASIGLVHQRRSWEKHTVSVETCDGFSIKNSIIDKEYSVKKELVSPALPFFPFLLGAYVIVLLLFYSVL